MKRSFSTVAGTVGLLALVTACEEDTLGEIHPQLIVCSAEDSAVTTCNQTFELGEVFTTVPTPVRATGVSLQIHVRETGS